MSQVIYFDNAATSWPKPRQVGEAMSLFLERDAANPGRGGHRMAMAAQKVMDDARTRIARLLHATAPERVALMSGATDALNAAIHGVLLSSCERSGATNGAKPHAVTTVIEHNAVTRPLNELHRRGWIDLDVVGIDAEGVVSADEVLGATNERTALVCVMQASNVTGALQPVHEIGTRLRAERPEALFLVDASQTAGLLPINVRTDPFDLVAFPGHKSLLGPTGTGALYVGERAYDQELEDPGMIGFRQGGTGGDSGSPYMPAQLPRRFEAGTPNTVGYAGLVAAMDNAPMTPEAMLAHERAIAGEILDAVRGMGGVTVLGPVDMSRRMGVATFRVEGMTAREIGTILDGTFNIATRPGLHCAPGAHKALGTLPDGALRVSPGPYTTPEDVSAFLEAFAQVAAAV
ncbi:MAG: aminotransferase class V-fold PLP-dependent enzyme [Phycisphaerales bacterium]|nr:MAG: aminotransferase class V-fold PLP-dependent enzyme [Phycisphaerales bacterium]